MCPSSCRGHSPPPSSPLPLLYKKSPQHSANDNRTALFHHEGLERTLAKTLYWAQTGYYSKDALERNLLTIQSYVTEMGVFLRDIAPANAYNDSRKKRFEIAQRTFNITELLELILENLSIPDILSFYQLNKAMRDAIEHSPKLQTRLCLRESPPDSHLRTPISNLMKHAGDIDSGLGGAVGFSCYSVQVWTALPINYKIENDSHTFSIVAFFTPLPGQRLYHMGNRYRSMFICQPPIRKMKVSMECCENYQPLANPPVLGESRTISSERGLTIGDLYDCAKALMKEHRWCPNAYACHLDENGIVVVDVGFSGTVHLQADDPLFIRTQASYKNGEADRQRNLMHHSKLEVYCRAK